MSLLTKNKKRCHQSGQGMIELAFAIPFFFIFIYGVMEFSLLFVQAQQIRTISREAANAGYRDCGSISPTSLDVCIENIVKDIGNLKAENLLPGFTQKGKIVLSVYVFDPQPMNPPVRLESQWCAGSVTGNGGEGLVNCGSRFDGNPPDTDFMAKLRFTVISEVFYDYEIFTPIQGILSGLDFPQTLYQVTAY